MAVISKLPTSIKSRNNLPKLWCSTLIILFVIAFTSFDKENQFVQVNGKCTGTMSIWEHTTLMNGSISSEGSDITDWTKPGYSTTLEFNSDSVAFYYAVPGTRLVLYDKNMINFTVWLLPTEQTEASQGVCFRQYRI